jgi:indoleamine 2,3-dioxygenase
MEALSTIFADHEAITQRGFLTPEPPLEPLSHRYVQWETIVANLPVLLMSHRLREFINSIPVLPTTYLTTTSERQRAYVVLTFLLHGYIWCGHTPAHVRHWNPMLLRRSAVLSSVPHIPFFKPGGGTY